MPFFSRRKKSRDTNAETKAAEAPKPAPYKHVPTHAAADSLMGVPAARDAVNRQAIKEAHSHRQSMIEERRMSRGISSGPPSIGGHNYSYSSIPKTTAALPIFDTPSSSTTTTSDFETSPVEMTWKQSSVKFEEAPIIINENPVPAPEEVILQDVHELPIGEINLDDAQLYLEATSVLENQHFDFVPPIPPRAPRPLRRQAPIQLSAIPNNSMQTPTIPALENKENWPLNTPPRIPLPTPKQERRLGMFTKTPARIRIEDFGSLLKQPAVHA
ncbi:MAG: hypothetical protein Q9227_006365 [Pyrenula ochraceoflavens]